METRKTDNHNDKYVVFFQFDEALDELDEPVPDGTEPSTPTEQ